MNGISQIRKVAFWTFKEIYIVAVVCVVSSVQKKVSYHFDRPMSPNLALVVNCKYGSFKVQWIGINCKGIP